MVWQGQRYPVTRIESRWRTPEGPAFCVRTETGERFELHYHEAQDGWTIRALPETELTGQDQAKILPFRRARCAQAARKRPTRRSSEMRDFVAKKIQTVPPSGIRRFFDIAATMDDVISLGIGEPDFATPPEPSSRPASPPCRQGRRTIPPTRASWNCASPWPSTWSGSTACATTRRPSCSSPSASPRRCYLALAATLEPATR